MKLIDSKILLFNLPLKTNEFGTIHQPKLKDFLDFDYVKFRTVFSVRKELYFDEDADGYDEIRDFDVIVFANLIDDFIESLKLLYKTDNIKINCKHNNLKSIGILIKTNEGAYCINRDNYTDFANLILILLHEGNNIAEEKVKKELDEIELKIEKKRKEFEKKKAKREAELRKNNSNKDEDTMTIFDIANYIIHNDNKYDYRNILELTIYQLMNTFTLYRQKEGYEVFMDYKTSGNFQIENDISHWFFGK